MSASDHARPGASRRSLMASGLSFGLPATGLLEDHDVASELACRWRRLASRQYQLIQHWQAREARVFQDPARLRLLQVNGHRSDNELAAIDKWMDELHDEREALLAEIILIPATTHRGLADRLSVLLSLLDPEDTPEAAALAASIRRDLTLTRSFRAQQ